MAETPTPAQLETLRLAVTYKAVRFLAFPGAPLGAWGEVAEGGVGVVTVRTDAQIRELLYGMGGVDWDVDLTAEVAADDVIRAGYETDPAAFPADRVADVERAIGAAAHWVAQYLLSSGVGV